VFERPLADSIENKIRIGKANTSQVLAFVLLRNLMIAIKPKI
jgi:hypothetical protein